MFDKITDNTSLLMDMEDKVSDLSTEVPPSRLIRVVSMSLSTMSSRSNWWASIRSHASSHNPYSSEILYG